MQKLSDENPSGGSQASIPDLLFFTWFDWRKISESDVGKDRPRRETAKKTGMVLVQFRSCACPQGECYWQGTQSNPIFNLSKTKQLSYSLYRKNNNLYLW